MLKTENVPVYWEKSNMYYTSLPFPADAVDLFIMELKCGSGFEMAYALLLVNSLDGCGFVKKMLTVYRWLRNRERAKLFAVDVQLEHRVQCLECTEKHISVAYYLLLESLQGYPEHITLAKQYFSVDNAIDTLKRLKRMVTNKHCIIGALSEAADECAIDAPELSAYIRECRMEFNYLGTFNADELIRRLEDVRNN